MPSAPNVIVLISHDTGRHFGCYGIAELDTPNTDALAARGLRLDRMFSTPTRAPAFRCSIFNRTRKN